MPTSALPTPQESERVARRRLPIGAELIDAGRTHARVWAPRAQRVCVVQDADGATELRREGNGYFSGVCPMGAGSRYRFLLDDHPDLFPDPASRFQPDGSAGPSEVVDPSAFGWTDQ